MAFLDQTQHLPDELPLGALWGKRLPGNTDGERQSVDHVAGRRQNVPFQAAANPTRQIVLFQG